MRAYLSLRRIVALMLILFSLTTPMRAEAAGLRNCSLISTTSFQGVAMRFSCMQQNERSLARQVDALKIETAALRTDRDALELQVADLQLALDTEVATRSTNDAGMNFAIGGLGYTVNDLSGRVSALERRTSGFDFVSIPDTLMWHDLWLRAMGEQLACMTGDTSTADALFAGRTQCPVYDSITLGDWVEELDGTTHRQGTLITAMNDDVEHLWDELDYVWSVCVP